MKQLLLFLPGLSDELCPLYVGGGHPQLLRHPPLHGLGEEDGVGGLLGRGGVGGQEGHRDGLGGDGQQEDEGAQEAVLLVPGVDNFQI